MDLTTACTTILCVTIAGKMVPTVGTIDLGTNQAEPTGECGLRTFRNPSEPTTSPPNLQ